MEPILTAIRALHFAAVIVLFGEYVYAYAVSPDGRVRPRFVAVTAWSLAIAVASAAAWLAIEAGHMSGEPIGTALADGTLRIVLSSTLFGHTWLVRAVLAAILALSLPGMRSGNGIDGTHAQAAQAIGAACAALLLVSLSCTGHAAADAGANGMAHLCVDGVHLLAAGAWLGALVPLAALLRESSRGSVDRAAIAVRRFSLLGIACVGALVLSGLVNASFALHDLASFVTSRYGRELSLKLLLFGGIVALAAVNRVRLTPRLDARDPMSVAAAQRALLRNAILEVVLGFAIVAIVGNLGITMPPMHGS